MKHFALTLLALVFVVIQSCHKNEGMALGSLFADSPSLLAPIRVQNNTLHFATAQEYFETRTRVFSASDEELLAWQKSLNFFSAQRFYLEARKDMCCPQTPHDIEMLRVKYGDKIRIDAESMDYTPILPLPKTCWMLNEHGEFWIGNMLIKYTEDRLMCVLDPNREKIALAMQNIDFNDSIKGIFVHPLIVDNSVEERGCPQSVITSVTVDPVDSAGGPIFNPPHTRQIKEASITIFDASIVSPGPGGTYVYNIEYDRSIYFLHKKKNFLGGWTICDRTTWTYSTNAVLAHNLAGLPSSNPASPATFNISNFTTGVECSYLRQDALLGGAGGTTASQYYGRLVTVQSMNLSVTANWSGISGSSSVCL
jgi:hypothetical protein